MDSMFVNYTVWRRDLIEKQVLVQLLKNGFSHEHATRLVAFHSDAVHRMEAEDFSIEAIAALLSQYSLEEPLIVLP
jgi:hypothetical protein